MVTKKASSKKSSAKKSSAKKTAAKKPAATKGAAGGGGKVQVLVEMRVPQGTPGAFAMAAVNEMPGFETDHEFSAVPMQSEPGEGMGLTGAAEETVIVRGTVDEDKLAELEARADVVRVFKDTEIAPFQFSSSSGPGEKAAKGSNPNMQPTPAMGTCPIPPCDCTFGNPANGTIASVATFLGVNNIWASGRRGDGIVIGIVDGGIRATGRPVSPGDAGKPRLSRIIDGWPAANWGTIAEWGDHGMMTATDALGMAPNAQIFDLRIASATMSGTISNALAAFQWAIDKHKATGKPHILSNSWGIFQESWDAVYARDPTHPFTRKVVEALDEGIIVLFAAGNCGSSCPDGRCGTDNGPGKSIWGANGHPRVITVGAVNINEKFVGYSSQGPAALDPDKPDFCSVTHFAGYFPTLNPASPSDGGTSAATPIAAGVVALMKQAKPSATQAQIKAAMKSTAKDIGPGGFDRHSGSGILRAKAAFDNLTGKTKVSDDPIKTKFTDDVVKRKIVDDVKLKFADDPLKFKPIDDVKSPVRDAFDRFPREDFPRFGGVGASPFVMATPHHAFGMEGQAGGGGYEMALAQYQSALGATEQAIQQATAELSQLQAYYQGLQEQYQTLAAQYQQEQSSGGTEGTEGGE
jgi:subtilisin family serine protease